MQAAVAGDGCGSAMGGDAKTGIAVNKSIPIATLKALSQDRPTPTA